MRIEQRLAAGILLAVVVGVTVWLLVDSSRSRTTQSSVRQFLDTHWQHPLAPQGDPPAEFTPVEASLAPGDCGQCHTDQYRDWSSSLHHQTMGPGIQWQFDLMAPAEANRCLRCHAPLAEQKALVARSRDWPNAPAAPPPDYVPRILRSRGWSVPPVMCESIAVTAPHPGRRGFRVLKHPTEDSRAPRLSGIVCFVPPATSFPTTARA